MTEFVEGWAVVEQYFSGTAMQEALRRSGPVALPAIAPLLDDTAAAMDMAASCGAAPHSLEQAILEGVPGEDAVDWTAARIRVGLQLTDAPAPAAELTATPPSASPIQAFASLMYFVTGGRRIPEKALFAASAYIPIPGLGNNANRTLAAVLAGETRPPDCRSLLLTVVREEGLSPNCIHRRREHEAAGNSVPPAEAEPGETVQPLRSPPRLKRPAILMAAAAVTVLGFGGWLLTRRTPASNRTAKTEPRNEPATATKDKPFTNSLGMKFVPVPGTQVLFCIHETRSKDFAAFIADKNRGYIISNSDADDWRTWVYKTVPVGRGEGEKAADSVHPAASVSWLDATAFCEWLSKKEGKSYRLPTDREWSIAVGIPQEPAGTPKELDLSGVPEVYPWDGKFVASAISGNYSDAEASAKFGGLLSTIEGYRDGFATTAPVMSFTPNRWGLYDLGGNLSEWCTNCYDGTDPLGKDKTLTESRVFRGGSWIDHDSAHLLSSNRMRDAPGIRNHRVGFRCVVVPGSGG